MRTRLAPTPSGHLHKGNAFSFLLTWQRARDNGGELFLRWDDLDTLRTKGDFAAAIHDDLCWLGLDWDFECRQSERTTVYERWLTQWRDAGQLYACRCTRSQLLERGGGIYPGTCRDLGLPLDDTNPWRLKLPEADVVVRRREGFAAYHLASLADDVELNMDYIVRGEDLRDSTTIQIAMARSAAAAGIEGAAKFAAATFVHHPLVTAPDGSKLSKSRGDAPLRLLREQGVSASIIYSEFLAWRDTFES